MDSPIQLIVGLGNPGDEHVSTRHNVGFWFVRALARWQGVELRSEKKFKGLVGSFLHEGNKVWLLCPTTFMNLSGNSVQALAKFYQIPPEAILVVHDDLDFPAGVVRLKQGGGHGGHNGLRHLLQCLSSPSFWRMRLGIGHPGHKDLVHGYVLASPSRADEAQIHSAIEQGEAVIPGLLSGDFQLAVRQLHQEGA